MNEIVASGIDVLSLDHEVDIGEARKLVGDDFTLFGNVHPTTALWRGRLLTLKESLWSVSRKPVLTEGSSFPEGAN